MIDERIHAPRRVAVVTARDQTRRSHGMALRNAITHAGWVTSLAGAIFDALAMAPTGPAVRGRPEFSVLPADTTLDV
jgi:hypothetical protein